VTTMTFCDIVPEPGERSWVAIRPRSDFLGGKTFETSGLPRREEPGRPERKC
jgi:hypothetical protein